MTHHVIKSMCQIWSLKHHQQTACHSHNPGHSSQRPLVYNPCHGLHYRSLSLHNSNLLNHRFLAPTTLNRLADTNKRHSHITRDIIFIDNAVCNREVTWEVQFCCGNTTQFSLNCHLPGDLFGDRSMFALLPPGGLQRSYISSKAADGLATLNSQGNQSKVSLKGTQLTTATLACGLVSKIIHNNARLFLTCTRNSQVYWKGGHG